MIETPKITIVTPSYNQGQFLRETIESVLKQKYPNLEYFIVDGGSTDSSIEIIKEYEDRIDWWVSEKDEGQSDAISKGFKKATGELLCWVNSDDVLFPGCLMAIGKAFLNKNRPDILHTNIAYIDSESSITRFIRVPRQSHFFFFRGVWHGTAPCVFFKRSLYDHVGGLNAEYRLSMDIDIWVKMMEFNARVEHIPCYLGGFRWHSDAKTVQSIDSRKTQENPETTAILNAYLPDSTPFKRKIWRRIYNIYQVMNFNYIREIFDLKKVGGRLHWEEAIRKLNLENRFPN